jgi:hypothetical protein
MVTIWLVPNGSVVAGEKAIVPRIAEPGPTVTRMAGEDVEVRSVDDPP